MKEISGSNNFYGWWISQDVTVKFYDIDGKYLGTQTSKYGKKEAESWYPNPKDSYNAGAYNYQGFAGKWRDISGLEIKEGSYTFGNPATLVLTPIYANKDYSDQYNITFINPNNGNSDTKRYDYRHILNGGEIPVFGVPGAIAYNEGSYYEFTGWTTQKPASGNYHIVAKDDTAFAENTDWIVREDTTYYAVYRSTIKEYVIAFTYTDTTGAQKTDIKYIPYGSAITTPADVNRTYATGGYGYTLEGWNYVNNDSSTVMFGVDDSLVFNVENVFLTQENLKGATPEKPIVFTANYDEGQPTPYTVTFKFKDAEGKDKVITDEVYHGYTIDAEAIAKLDTVPEQYDDGAALYTFSGFWKVTEGTAGKAEYAKDEFAAFGPTSHVTFEALYGEGVPFYTVKYVDGTATYSERVLAGSTVPAWVVGEGEDAKEYIPAKADTETGEYEFLGWYDEEQTDPDFAAANGNKYTTADTVDGDLVLYSQFKFSGFKFIIKFMNYDGTVQLSAVEVEAGQSYADAFYTAQRAAQYRPADETYTYTFIGWDQPYNENYLICEGKNVTFKALYQPSYIYYKAHWYNSADDMGDVKKALATTNYTYEGAVYAPSVDLVVPEGKVFAGWKYLKDGVETDYVRGMTITADMDFYATFKDAEKVYTVTVVVGDEETEYKVPAGEKATAVGTPLDGYLDETNHNKFEGWFTEDDAEFDLDTAITADITITAKFTVTEHTKNQKELVNAPTYYAKGSEIIWCACNRDETDETVEIPMLTDTKAPTGTIYLGTLGSWSSSDAVGAAATDNDPVTLYANADTDIILTITDTGDVNNAYNPSGEGKGIANIQGIISTGVFGAGTTEIAGIQTIYSDDSETLNNTANYVVRLGTYNLESGTTYIAYYYARDKAGNELNKNVRTAKFIYDDTAPEITVVGDTNAESTAKIKTYCGKAEIKDIENDAVVTVNGAVVTLTTTSAAGTGSYTISDAGNYIITVTDKAGNTATKKIIVNDGHDEVKTSQAATCTEDGYEKVICAICNKVIKNETIESEGHKYSAEETVAPTCTEGGYTIKVCSVCGYEVITNQVPALNHEDQDTYTKVTKEATCLVKGEKTTYCEACDAVLSTEDIPVDTVNGHLYGEATKVLRATCDKDGKEYVQCKYCYEMKTTKVLPKLEHKDTGRYTKITTAPTCYAEGVETTYCKECDTVMGTAPVAMIAHTLVLVKYDKDTDKSDDYPNGYMQYECQIVGCGHTEGKTAIAVKATYTVTFKGAGAEGADVVITKTEGETIAANAVADQTKAQDNEYIYTFAGWKGTDGKIVKLPVTVTKDETYTAEFTSAKRTYTHTFKINENDQTNFATIVGVYNDTNKKPTRIPTKAATATTTYEFTGWASAGSIETEFKMTGDATFVATFKPVAIEFNVIFYNADGTYVWSTTGDVTKNSAYDNKDGEGNLIVPVKAPDAENHYTFAGWKLGEETIALGESFAVSGKTTLTATYTATAHQFAVVNNAEKTWAATCEKAGQTTEVCACGYEKVTTIPALKHDFENGTVTTEDITLEDGTVIKAGSTLCARYDDCGAYQAPAVKEVKITFAEKIGEETAELKAYNVEEGSSKKYTAPEKAATESLTYKFKNWIDAEGNVVSETAEITVTAGTEDAVYYAVYEAATRYYVVTYVDADNNIISTYKLEYGAAVPAAPAAPAIAPTKTDHYIFTDWSYKVTAESTVTGDLLIKPVFDVVAHDWYETDESAGATCTEAGGTVWACTGCDVTETRGGKPATGHKLKLVETVAPTATEKGYSVYKCENCDYTETRDLPDDYFKITVKVLDEDGNPVADTKVSLLKDGVEVMSKETDNTGTVVFSPVEAGAEYSVYIASTGETNKVTVDEDGKVTGGNIESKPEKVEEDNSCKCSCHKNTFWGVIFRLFQKIIKFFTGKATCCANPDSRI